MKEDIYEVYWIGPYTDETIDEIENEDRKKYVLYKIYGFHPLYGHNVLLYIGKTKRGVNIRLKEHQAWIDADQLGDAKIYIASLGEFTNWEASEKITLFEQADDSITSKIESLLIYAHQPVYNSMNKKSADSSKNIRIFNTGTHGLLFPEISSCYQNIVEK
jgi:hypothetical protein